MAFSRWFWYELSREVMIEMSSEDLTGAVGFVSRMVHLYGCWLEA